MDVPQPPESIPQHPISAPTNIHQDNGIAHHEAYDQGMRRLSCRACPLAHTDDLVRSAQINPGLFDEYADAEDEMGNPFKKSISLRGIVERARS
ncbi:hypothetical protein [Kitasatospora sp. CB01950]|uniref:hypothetical protein n=2 Tax=unclassified Kitasatospora TaxID=2633591 RepID=UPI001161372B|nr:hypothetical protein [Kitasatospora sp. CB01950]